MLLPGPGTRGLAWKMHREAGVGERAGSPEMGWGDAGAGESCEMKDMGSRGVAGWAWGDRGTGWQKRMERDG